jgi:hypothetical protein
MGKLGVAALIMGLCLASAAQAVQPVPQGARDTSNPYNSPIRRANPNSMQGTVPPTRPLPNSTPILNDPRPPTLQNRGIGNGENLRRAPTRQPTFETPRQRTTPQTP